MSMNGAKALLIFSVLIAAAGLLNAAGRDAPSAKDAVKAVASAPAQAGLASDQAVSARAAASQPAVPTTALPEKVRTILREAIDSYKFSDSREDTRQKQLQSLDALREAPWLDLDKVRWVRLRDANDANRSAVAMCLSEHETAVAVVLPDLSVRLVERNRFSKIEPVDYTALLAGFVKKLKERDPAGKRPWDFTFIEDFGAGGFPYHGGVFLLQHAYYAAWYGKSEEATLLVHEALSQRENAVEGLLNEGAWQLFLRGLNVLEEMRPRDEVLALWEQALKTYPTSRYEEQLQEYVALLRKQIVQDKELARWATDPNKLPLPRRVEYYVARWPDVHGVQFTQPGHCLCVGWGQGTKLSNAVVAIGRPAIPVLIEHLTDRRLTRSIGFYRNFVPSRTVLRVQDVAVQCIDKILDIQFYRESSTSSYFSTEKPEVREAVIAAIKEWWAKHGSESPVQGQLALLELGKIWERIDTLGKIEKLDPKAVDSIATLKRWTKGANAEDLIRIADALAPRGDFSLLPAMQEMLRRPRPPSECVWYILRHGVPDDFRFILAAGRKEIDAGVTLGSLCTWGAVVGAADSYQRPLMVPLLVDLLDRREMTGSRYMSGFKESMPFSAADTCIGALIRLTGHDEGYKLGDPAESRFAAIDRWAAWWEKDGKAEFIKKHPEVAAVYGMKPTPSTVSASRPASRPAEE